MPKTLFPLGTTVATPGALATLEEAGVGAARLLARHQQGDWGELCPEDAASNDEALQQGLQLLSSYHVGDRKIWVITEADRSVTTLLCPEEY